MINYKTDGIYNTVTRNNFVNGYKSQMLRYEIAVENLLGGKPKISLCFLDDHESINLIPVN